MSAACWAVWDRRVFCTKYKRNTQILCLIIKPTSCTDFCNLFLEWNSTCFGQFLCPSSGVFHCTHSKPVWHIPLLCVQWKTPDDGQRNCSKHIEFHSKNKSEKLVHLVDFIVREEDRSYSSVLFCTVRLITASTPALGSRQPSIQWAPGSFPGYMRAGAHLVPRLRMSGAVPLYPLYGFKGCTGENITFTLNEPLPSCNCVQLTLNLLAPTTVGARINP